MFGYKTNKKRKIINTAKKIFNSAKIEMEIIGNTAESSLNMDRPRKIKVGAKIGFEK